MKEVLTFTEVKVRKKKLSLLLVIIVIPLFLVTALFSPLLENLSLIDGIKVKFTKEGKETISNGSNFSNFKTYESNYLALSTFSSLSDNRFILLPVFEIAKKKRRNNVSSHLMIYDKQNSISGHFRVIKKISFFNLLDKGRTKFGFWNITYPNLFNVLTGNRHDYLKKKFSDSFGAVPLLDKKAQQDISRLIRDSFELGLPTLFKHAQDQGPFIRGHMVVRNELIALFDEGSVFEVDINQLGSNDFLQMKQKFAKSIKENIYYEVFIPLFTNNGPIFQISFPGGTEGNDARTKFKETFFSVVKWYFDYKEIFPVPTSEAEYSPLRILDHYISSTSIPQEERNILQKYIYKYYYEIGQSALKDENKNLENILILHLDRYLLVAQMMNKKFGKDYYNENFLNSLKILKVGLLGNDFKFFELKARMEK